MSECIQQQSTVTMESVVKAIGSCVSSVILLLLLFSVQLCSAAGKVQPIPISRFNRSSFPPDFLFGAASAAYQNEGAAFEGGKGPSAWDTFAHTRPEKIADGTNGDVANDFYHRYKEDVKLMKYVGLDAYRMSISWPRILPSGKLSGGVNKEGVAFYNNVFNELLANGITPFVTLFHWDTPQALDDEYEAFLSPHIIDDFKDFANVCFKEFGDRIKHWITINEPFTYTSIGYDFGVMAPGRCSNRTLCPKGNSATEPYIVGHHLILCHATAVKLYKHKYQGSQKGEIGITLDTRWFLPYSNTIVDTKATQRAFDFVYGWFIDPIVLGDYPKSVRSIVGDRLPKFTKEETEMVKGSIDFLGINYYTGAYVRNVNVSNGAIISYTDDRKADFLTVRNGVAIGESTGVGNFYVYPQGLHDLLVYTKEKYNNPKIYITENGCAHQNNGTTEQSISDPQRIAFHHDHLQAAQKAKLEGVNLKGYIAWSFTDVYEWSSGFTVAFGLVYVDRKNGLKRTPKRSAIWYKKFLNK